MNHIEIPPLPYAKDALEPHISARTLEYHYEKHHKGYLAKLEAGIEGTPQAEQTLEELIRSAEGDVFNNAAQVWNHTFYWRSMRPDGGGKPDGEIAEAIASSFGSYEAFRKEFTEAAKGEFGSGWAWLALDGSGRLLVRSSSDADNPLRVGQTPLLTLDVWEHAYYLDHQNDRGAYVEAFLDHLLDWEFVAENLTRAAARGAAGTGGEGNPEADQRYRQGASEFASSQARVDRAARRAADEEEAKS